MRPVELHMHSFFSFMDALASPEELVGRAGELGYSALALTDHGGLFGIPRFLKAADAGGIKPIIGCEVYVSPASRADRSAEQRPVGYHLTLLAETLEGYKNLVKLSSAGFAEGFFYRPRVDLDLLGQHSKGLILLTGCIHSAFCDRLLQDDAAGAEKLLGFYMESFGRDQVFLEIQSHGLEQETILQEKMTGLAKKFRIPRVATNDVHFLRSEDAETHKLAMDMRSRKLPTDPRRARFLKPAYGLRTVEEWMTAFGRRSEAMETQSLIASRCKLSSKDIHLKPFQDQEDMAYQRIESLARSAADRRWHHQTTEQEERIGLELRGIKGASLAGYILRVHELVVEAKRQGIILGPGRGSSAGSLIAHLLDITEINPLEYGLSFERFISPSRSTMPDIDLDVDYRHRRRMIEILQDLDPSTKTFRVGSFSSVGLKAAIREVARSQGMPYKEVDDKIRSIPDGQSRLESEEREPWPTWAPMINILAGLLRTTIGHPAGVVVVPKSSEDYLPLYASPEGQTWLQFDGEDIEWLGAQKLDILPVKFLAVIAETLRWLKMTGTGNIDLASIPLTDPDTFRKISEGKTLGIFQLESPGVRCLLKELMPDSIESLAAALALYRPAPLSAGLPAAYVDRRHGKMNGSSPHPMFDPILKETYGLILYQEQIMACARRVGMTSKEADEFRLALSKKSQNLTRPMELFVNALRSAGLTEKETDEVLSQLSSHAAFAFNKAHAISYALLVYRGAYLKAHFSTAFLASLANESLDDRKYLGEIFSEARKLDIRIISPDINTSGVECIPQPDPRLIRLGLRFVRNVSEVAMSDILRCRPFEDVVDLLMKVPELSKQKSLEMFCKVGALDAFGRTRNEVLESLPRCVEKAKLSEGQGGLQTDLFEDRSGPDVRAGVSSSHDNLFYEHEAIGCFATGSPLDELRHIVSEFCSGDLEELKSRVQANVSGEPSRPILVTAAGLLTSLRQHTDRAGREMAFAKLEDGVSDLDMVFFSDAYQKSKSKMKIGMPLLVRGRLEKKGASVTLLVDQAVGMDQPDKLYESILLKLDQETGMDVMRTVKQTLKDHPGDRPVYIEMMEGPDVYEFRVGWSCKPSAELRRKLENILGPNAVFFLKSKESPIRT